MWMELKAGKSDVVTRSEWKQRGDLGLGLTFLTPSGRNTNNASPAHFTGFPSGPSSKALKATYDA